jgi:hypothetical protein
LEIGPADYAPTCGNRRRQGSCGFAIRQATAVQPTYVPRTTTQKLILYLLCFIEWSLNHESLDQQCVMKIR